MTLIPDCTIKRSKRKTMALEITPEGNLIIRAPLHASEHRILSFFEDHREWIAGKIREIDKKRKLREEYEKKHPVKRLTDEELRELGRAAAEYIPMRTAHYAAMMGVDFGRITIRNQTTRWGSCSAKKNLNFNVLLMLAPKEVIDSVIVHELCHILHMDHSKAFYADVLRFFPDYHRWDRWLKDHGEELLRSLPVKEPVKESVCSP